MNRRATYRPTMAARITPGLIALTIVFSLAALALVAVIISTLIERS